MKCFEIVLSYNQGQLREVIRLLAEDINDAETRARVIFREENDITEVEMKRDVKCVSREAKGIVYIFLKNKENLT